MPGLSDWDKAELNIKTFDKVEVLTAKSNDKLAKDIFSYDTGIEEVWVYREAKRRAWIAAAIYPGKNFDTTWGSYEPNRKKALESLTQKIKEQKPSTRDNVETQTEEGAQPEGAQSNVEAQAGEEARAKSTSSRIRKNCHPM